MKEHAVEQRRFRGEVEKRLKRVVWLVSKTFPEVPMRFACEPERNGVTSMKL
jgi:hypothetical protein